MATRRAVPALVLLAICLLTFWKYPVGRLNQASLWTPGAASTQCHQHPLTDRVAVIVKTGASEANEKLPIILATSLRCVNDPILVSDLEQDLGGRHLHNVLANYSEAVTQSDPEFAIYREQQRLAQAGQFDQIAELRNRKDPTGKKSAAWDLDKYKNLYALELAWRLQPGKDWYIFVDADTYLFWPNLLTWLASGALGSPQHASYWGRPFLMHEREDHPIWFAHGGSGYIISGAAARAFNEDKPGIARKWESKIKHLFYGDFSVAAAFDEELNIQMGDARPLVNGVAPAAIPFRPETWCQPLVTLHHMTGEDVQMVSELEKRVEGQAVRFTDLYAAFYHEDFPTTRIEWHNMADDRDWTLNVTMNNQTKTGLRRMSVPEDATLIDAHASYAGCQLACEISEDCVQFAFWEWRGTKTKSAARLNLEISNRERDVHTRKTLSSKCHLSMAVRLGAKQEKDPERDETWTSGWMTGRIRDRTKRQWKCDFDRPPS